VLGISAFGVLCVVMSWRFQGCSWRLGAAMDRLFWSSCGDFVLSSVVPLFCLDSSDFLAFVLRGSALSAGRAVIVRDVRMFLHM